jgi:hypothetical protein
VVQPMHALRGEYIMEEGKPGRELYMILKAIQPPRTMSILQSIL